LVLTEGKQREILNLFEDNLGDLTKLQRDNFGTIAKSTDKKEDRIRI
jgi:hypothetical protein